MLNALIPIGKAIGGAILTAGAGKAVNTIFGDGSKQNQTNIRAQLNASKELTDYNLQKQLELWEKTNYDEQRKQMEKAGLSVSLMHNLGGAGGSTAIQTGGMPTIDKYSEMLNARTAQAQLAMQQSQIELNKAQAEKTRAEADNIAGVERELKGVQIKELMQGIENKKAEKLLNEANTRLINFENKIKELTEDEILENIGYINQKLEAEANIMRYEWSINAETANTKIKMIKEAYKKIILENALVKAQTNLTKTEANKKAEEINNLIQERVLNISRDEQGWQKLSNEQKQIEINKEANRIKQQIANTYGIELGVDAIKSIITLGKGK